MFTPMDLVRVMQKSKHDSCKCSSLHNMLFSNDIEPSESNLKYYK